MEGAYETLAREIADAGFLTNGVEDYGTWDRTCVCSKRRTDGGLTGNSFWVSRRPGGWYLGVWGGSIYRMPDEGRLAELCIAWLSREPNRARADFDDRLKLEFGLVMVSRETFDAETGRGA